MSDASDELSSAGAAQKRAKDAVARFEGSLASLSERVKAAKDKLEQAAARTPEAPTSRVPVGSRRVKGGVALAPPKVGHASALVDGESGPRRAGAAMIPAPRRRVER